MNDIAAIDGNLDSSRSTGRRFIHAILQNHPLMERIDWAAQAIAVCVCIVAATYLWCVFFPAIMTPDSIVQYGQARTATYDDIHPPIMAGALAAIFLYGGDIQHLMLMQCLAGAFAPYLLARQTLRFAFGNRLSNLGVTVSSLAVLLALLTPISALPFYLMTFWKDVWVSIAFCWLGTGLLALANTPTTARWHRWVLPVAITFAAMTIAVQSRHNAIVIVPACSLALAGIVAGRGSRGWILVALLAPPLSQLAAGSAIRTTLNVRHVNVQAITMRAEMMGIAKEFPRLRPHMPHLKSLLTPNFARHYVHGNVLSNGPGLMATPDYVQIEDEYIKLATLYPGAIAYAKYKAFAYHFTEHDNPVYYDRINDNPYGLSINPTYSDTRKRMADDVWLTFHDDFWKWPFARHVPWLVANVAAVGCLLAIAWVARQRKLLVAALLLTITLAYYFSYVVATQAADYRYMYPSTLALQTVALALAFGSFWALAGWTIDAGARRCSKLTRFVARRSPRET